MLFSCGFVVGFRVYEYFQIALFYVFLTYFLLQLIMLVLAGGRCV